MAFRWQVILACWDEYAATNLSAGIGEDQTDNYESVFLGFLANVRQTANDHIKQYRLHGRVDEVLAAVYGTYGNLLKFSAYCLGNLSGRDIAVSDRSDIVNFMAGPGHWFAPYFTRLERACQDIADNYGSWADQTLFEVIGDIADDLVASGGIFFRYPEPDQLYIEIPFTEETTPAEGE